MRRFLILLLALAATLIPSLGAAQTILPFDVAVQEGTQPVGTLQSLKVDDSDVYTLNTVPESGSNHQVASILAQFTVPAGTPSALLHAVTGASLTSRTWVQVWLYNPTTGNPNLGSTPMPGTTSANGVVEVALTGDQLAQYRDSTTGRLYVQFRMYRTYAANDNPTVSFRIGQLAILKPIFPTTASVLEGTLLQGGVTSLQAIDADYLGLSSTTGAGNKAASFLAKYTLPLGVTRASLRALVTSDQGSGLYAQSWLYNATNGNNPPVGTASILSNGQVAFTLTNTMLAQGVDPATGITDVQFRAYGASTFNWWTDQLVIYADPVLPPAAPTSLAATAASSSAINLTWTDNATTETGYLIERKTGAGAFAQVATAPANATSFADSGLAASTSYTYRVRTTNSGGESGYSNEATATTAFDPAPPTYCTAYATGATSIRVYWDPIPNVVTYRVYRSTTPDARTTGILVATVSGQVGATWHWDDASLSSTSDYYYQVTGVVGSNETDPSIEDCVAPISGALPLDGTDAAISQAAKQISGDSNAYAMTPDGRIIDPSGVSTPNWTVYNPAENTFTLSGQQNAPTAPTFIDNLIVDASGITPEGAYRKVLTSEFFTTRQNGCSATYYLPSPSQISIGPSVNGVPLNSLCAYNGVVTKSVEIDSGVQYFGATGAFPNRHSPVLRIADVREKNKAPDRYVKLNILHFDDAGIQRYVTMGPNDTAVSSVYFRIDRSARRTVVFAVTINRFTNGVSTALTGITLVAVAPVQTRILGDNAINSLEKPSAKQVISFAQKRRVGQSFLPFTFPPSTPGWPNGFYSDGSTASGATVTDEMLYDGGVASSWRDRFQQNTIVYVSRNQATSQETALVGPATIVNFRHQ